MILSLSLSPLGEEEYSGLSSQQHRWWRRWLKKYGTTSFPKRREKDTTLFLLFSFSLSLSLSFERAPPPPTFDAPKQSSLSKRIERERERRTTKERLLSKTFSNPKQYRDKKKRIRQRRRREKKGRFLRVSSIVVVLQTERRRTLSNEKGTTQEYFFDKRLSTQKKNIYIALVYNDFFCRYTH